MKTRGANRVLWALVLAVTTTGAHAQFDFGFPGGGGGGGFSGQDSRPWSSLKLDPKTRVRLAFRNASVEAVLAFYEKSSKITIVNDPNLKGPMTLTSATPVSLSKSFQILSSKLDLMGFTLSRDEDILVIKKKPTQTRGAAAMGSPMAGGVGMPGGMGGNTQSQNILKVYAIKFASATEIARVLNEVFSMQQQGTSGASGTTSGFPALPGGGAPGGGGPGGFPGGGGGPGGPPGGGGGGAEANAELDRTQWLADTQGGGGRGGQGGGPGGGFPGGGGGFPGGGMQGGPGGSRSSGSNVVAKASAETFTNSVLVYASASIHAQVESLLKELDRPSESVLESKFFRLQYADASSTATSISNLLNANNTTGRGSTSSSATQSRGGFPFFGGGSSQSNNGTVTADTRANAILVTATPANMKLVEKILPEIDMPVKMESTTFVFPLANARASDVASLLSSAYGQRSGTGTSRTGTTSTTRTTTGTNSNRNQNSGGGGGLGGQVLPSGYDLALQDPNALAGELQTNIAAQGFGGFGGFGGQTSGSRSNTSSTDVARDASGRVVNTRDLTNQVTVVADPNTNSVIVVTSPENADLIRNVLDQLDRIPEQVMIETIIVEATLDATTKLGFEWSWALDKALGIKGATGTASAGFGQSTTAQGFSYTLTTDNFDGFLNMLNQDQRFRVLSTPRIFTSNNVDAQINISQSVPYVTNSRQNTDGTFSFNYSFEDVGIVLSVTPHITANGYVTMDVTQTANELQGYTDFNAPIVNQREAQTTVSVQDGETIVLGGIIRNSVTSTVKKLPMLGDLPVLGNIFRSTSKEKSQTELLVFLRPRVVRNSEDARKLSDEAKKNMGKDVRKDFDKAKGGGN